MKKIVRSLLLFGFTFLFSLMANAQFQTTGVKLVDDISWPSNQSRRSLQNPKTCNQDTVDYTRFKVTAYNSISIRTGSSLGQFYTAPKNGITLHGMTFYAWSIDSPSVSIVCNIYKAGVDSLPTGNPLTADTMTIDSTFGGGMLSVLIKNIKFKKPIKVYDSYVIVLATTQSNRRAGVVASSWANSDGQSENLLCGSVSGTWYNGLNLNIGGTTLDADMQFYPHVSYEFGAGLALLDTCYKYQDTVKFLNYTRDSTVASNKFYNRYMYYKERYNNDVYEDICYRWNYGEYNNTIQKAVGANKYQNPGNYTVRLIAYTYPWRGQACVDTSTIEIKFQPATPTISGPPSVCEGDSFDLLAYSNGVKEFEWFHNQNDVTPFFKGDMINSGSLPKTDTVFVRAVNGNCISQKQMRVYSIFETPDDPKVTHDSICTQSKANLSATTNIGEIQWFSSPSNNTVIHTGNVYQTGILNSDFTYYVHASHKGCLSANRVPVTAYVSSSFAPQAPMVSNDTTLCIRTGKTVELNASVTNSNSIRWYTQPSGGAPFTTGTTYNHTTTQVGKEFFYVEAWNGTCGSTREAIEVETKDYPDIFKTKNDTICKGEDGAISAVVFSGKINWFNAMSGGTSEYEGETYNFLKPTTSSTYYVESSDGVCVNPTRLPVYLVVNDYKPFSEKNSAQICAKSPAELSAKVSQGIIQWYDEETGGNLLNTGETFTTPTLQYSKDYYIETTNEGCTSPREKISVVVLPRPVAGFEYSVTWPKRVILNPITTTGVKSFWDMDDGNTYTSQGVNHNYEAYGEYNIMQVLTSNANGCKDSTTVKVIVDFTSNKDVKRVEYTLYPNPNKGAFSLYSSEFNSEEWTVRIYDMTGKLVQEVQETPLSGKIDLNINHSGIYFIQAYSSNKSISSKVIVE